MSLTTWTVTLRSNGTGSLGFDVDDARTRKLVDLEIEMQGRLKHPLIAELYEVMKVDKMVFMVRTEHSSPSLEICRC